MSCTQPIEATILTEYWLAALTPAEEEAIEEHLLGCDKCGETLRQVIALADGIHNLAREGKLRLVVSDTFLKRAAENGVRVREYAPPRGGAIQCTATSDDRIVAARLAATIGPEEQLDLCFYDEHGVELDRMPDIPFRPGSNEVVYQESITFLQKSPTSTMIARLVSGGGGGNEQVLGEYTFHHTRTLPGPGGW